ncbi:adenosine deaminase [Marinicella sp. W31]|uniref:adenosine deaminase n=1 Tax=Marinicella sp. W31 TaxID=3023713 RepID=UPI00375706D3
MSQFIERLPKVELHMHIEGSMEPEMLLQLADKNKITLPYADLDAVKAAYNFADLAAFVDLYIKGTEVVCDAEDFYTITMEYLKKCHQENILHTEIFCDIRTYVDRGYAPEMVIEGIDAGFKAAYQEFGITGGMMPCFIRHLGAEPAMQDLDMLLRFKDKILAIGLAAVEVGFPPSMFTDVFDRVRAEGIPVVAHAGEEGSPDYIWSAIRDIKVDRIDHGVRCLEDAQLVEYLKQKEIPLTVCPCSNVSLNVFERMEDHVLPQMLEAGLKVTVNSDDPAHFGAYLSENLTAVQNHCGVTDQQLLQMQQNAVDASFATPDRKAELHQRLAEI